MLSHKTNNINKKHNIYYEKVIFSIEMWDTRTYNIDVSTNILVNWTYNKMYIQSNRHAYKYFKGDESNGRNSNY